MLSRVFIIFLLDLITVDQIGRLLISYRGQLLFPWFWDQSRQIFKCQVRVPDSLPYIDVAAVFTTYFVEVNCIRIRKFIAKILIAIF